MAAIPHARAGTLVTFGVVPDHPETGYGYIRRGDPVVGAYALDRFVEKPDAATARAYLEAEEYYFGTTACSRSVPTPISSRWSALRRGSARPVATAVAGGHRDLDFLRLDQASFVASPPNSIDYAAMETTDRGVVIPLDAGWNDIGAWDALATLGLVDRHGNTERGDDIHSIDSESCIMLSEGRLLTTVGVRDLIVSRRVEAGRARRDRVPPHRASPLGTYEGLSNGLRYQVKRVRVKPGASLSLQKHHHHAEHWIVVKGTAVIVRGDESLLLTENQSTYIPLGVVHLLKDPGKIGLEIFEVQPGKLLCGDDIVRLQNDYGQ